MPILLLLDTHKSHINPEVAEFCSNNKILLNCLLPNTTHLLQPCDVGYLDQLNKQALRKVTFGSLFAEAFKTAAKEETIKSAFVSCGFFPFDVSRVNFSKSMSSRHENDQCETPNETITKAKFL